MMMIIFFLPDEAFLLAKLGSVSEVKFVIAVSALATCVSDVEKNVRVSGLYKLESMLIP